MLIMIMITFSIRRISFSDTQGMRSIIIAVLLMTRMVSLVLWDRLIVSDGAGRSHPVTETNKC